jgi:ankyrin repeat protein
MPEAMTAPIRRAAASVALVFPVSVASAAQAPTPASDKADAFAAAVRNGDAAAVKALLDQGVDVNTKFRYNATALSFAADRGHVEVVKLLLDRGADVNAADTFYNATPLTWAVGPAMGRKPQHVEVVRLLLAKGGTPADRLSDALEAATRTNQDEVVALLKAAGAKPKDK